MFHWLKNVADQALHLEKEILKALDVAQDKLKGCLKRVFPLQTNSEKSEFCPLCYQFMFVFFFFHMSEGPQDHSQLLSAQMLQCSFADTILQPYWMAGFPQSVR